MNKICLMGRLAADPELKNTSKGGIAVTSFSIAVARPYSKEGQVDFIPCQAWRGTAEFICKYFSKGQMIAIDGSLITRKYQDKNGNNRTAFEVVIEHAFFTSSKSQAQGNGKVEPTTEAQGNDRIEPTAEKNSEQSNPVDYQDLDVIIDDDLPFC